MIRIEQEKNGKVIIETAFTFCVYENRNTDHIIINGKKGYINITGELPYCKGEHLARFSCGQYQECAEKLIELIKEFYSK